MTDMLIVLTIVDFVIYLVLCVSLLAIDKHKDWIVKLFYVYVVLTILLFCLYCAYNLVIK